MSQALVGVQALHQLSWWRPTKQLFPCLFYTASFRNSWKDSSMARSEEYSVYYHCECPNRYKSESPLCLGVLKAPEGQQSRKQYFWNIRKKLGLDVKEVAFVEVVPGKNAETACKGYQDCNLAKVGLDNWPRQGISDCEDEGRIQNVDSAEAPPWENWWYRKR